MDEIKTWNATRNSVCHVRISPRAKLPIVRGTYLRSNRNGELIRARSFKEAQFYALDSTEDVSTVAAVQVL